VEDLGPPVAYLAVEEGTPVYDRSGERLGVVEHVLADEQLDIFEGIVIHTHPLPGSHVYADVEQIDELHERGILLSVAGSELHEPPDAPAAMETQPDDVVESPLEARLRRAWDWISGRR
jgi:uncharacterized protein YrrD